MIEIQDNTNILNGNLDKAIDAKVYEETVKPMLTLSENAIIKFDPLKHLSFDKRTLESTRRLTLEQLNLNSQKKISDIAVSDPFPLFTEEAIDIMRNEFMKEAVFKKFARRLHHSTSTDLECTLRGYAKDMCPFTYAAWTHPLTVSTISMMAGIELVPVMDYEIAHINLAMKEESIEAQKMSKKVELKGSADEDDPNSIIRWHKDSYPFVCVLMLSDTTTMCGGGTSLMTGNGEIISVPHPTKGYASILQGGLINHNAPKPSIYSERITAVTSYRAKNPRVYDSSSLHTVKPERNHSTNFHKFYPEWVSYRMKVVIEMCQLLSNEVDQSKNLGKSFEKEKVMKEINKIDDYIETTWKEMIVTEEEWNDPL